MTEMRVHFRFLAKSDGGWMRAGRHRLDPCGVSPQYHEPRCRENWRRVLNRDGFVSMAVAQGRDCRVTVSARL
jgi:hypothetical protein